MGDRLRVGGSPAGGLGLHPNHWVQVSACQMGGPQGHSLYPTHHPHVKNPLPPGPTPTPQGGLSVGLPACPALGWRERGHEQEAPRGLPRAGAGWMGDFPLKREVGTWKTPRVSRQPENLVLRPCTYPLGAHPVLQSPPCPAAPSPPSAEGTEAG